VGHPSSPPPRLCDRSALPSPESCPDLAMPVCASDRRTYDSACLVELQACHQNNSLLYVIYEGDCRPDYLCEDGITYIGKEQVTERGLPPPRSVTAGRTARAAGRRSPTAGGRRRLSAGMLAPRSCSYTRHRPRAVSIPAA
jgi:hypothetical protein